MVPPISPSTAGTASSKPLLLGRYDVGRELGHGKFSKVFYAKNAASGEEVAIKVSDKKEVFRDHREAQIRREIAALRRLRHPNIVRLLEVMATKSKIYFVMEYVAGGELLSLVEERALPESGARAYFQQLISAVSFCHARRVFHRDIKPQNLLLDVHGVLKVVDFGLSAVAEFDVSDAVYSHTDCGTLSYIAPEVLGRRRYDPGKADIWSCGVVLFVLLTRTLPFYDKETAGTVRKIYQGKFRPPRSFSPELTNLLKRIFVTEPDKRITMAEIKKDAWFKIGFEETVNSISMHDDDDDADSLESDVSYATDEIRTLESPVAEAFWNPVEPILIGGVSGMRSSASMPAFRSALTAPSSPARSQPGTLVRPKSLTAFDIISFSRGLDLSPLLGDQDEELRFVSQAPLTAIIAKVDEAARSAGFSKRATGPKGNMQMVYRGGGSDGMLSVAVEILELTPKVVVVEVKREEGLMEEYREFSEMRLRPAVEQLVYDSLSESEGGVSDAD